MKTAKLLKLDSDVVDELEILAQKDADRTKRPKPFTHYVETMLWNFGNNGKPAKVKKK